MRLADGVAGPRTAARALSRQLGAAARLWQRGLWGDAWWRVSVLGALLAVGLCLITSHTSGFPLDDGWIHQDFARTLATTGQFAFQPGRSGAGSTSPLWVVLLAPPYLLLGAHAPLWAIVGWVALLGALALGTLGIVTGVAAAELVGAAGGSARVVGVARLVASLAVVTEWHLVWAAASGMETVLFASLVMLLIVAASRGIQPQWLGALAAVCVAVRPEGILLVGILLAASGWTALRADAMAAAEGLSRARSPLTPWARSLRRWLGVWALPFLVGVALGLLPYVWLNVATSGQIVPSTVSAKAAYYGPMHVVGAIASYGSQVLLVMVASSPALLVLGGLSYSHRLQPRGVRNKTVRTPPNPAHSSRHGGLSLGGLSLGGLLLAWPAVLVVAYAGHLSLLVHHGRYLMPALPPVLALTAAGAAPLLVAGRALWSAVGAVLLAVTSAVSLGRGAQIYAENVQLINGCQVDTALWLRAHTAPGALFATHDIGAIGYFGGHPLVDLAGLVDPQVVPLLSDQPKLEGYLARRHVRYVIEFTDWFGPPNVLARDLGSSQVYHSRAVSNFVVLQADW